MSGKKLLSACTAAVFSAFLAMAVVMTTSFTPVLADGPSFGCNAGDDDDSDDKTRGDCGLMQNFPVCGAPGNTAFETHRDCVENMSFSDWMTDPLPGQGFGGCGTCHSLERPDVKGGYMNAGFIGPSCQTCHGRKWDFGDDKDGDKDGDKDDDDSRAVTHRVPLDGTTLDPEKAHRDHVEDNGLVAGGLTCVTCHGKGGTLDHNMIGDGGGPGCAYCHDADKACDAPDAGAPGTGTDYCEDDDSSS